MKTLFIYLTERERQREREHKQGDWEREKQASRRAGSPMWGSIPGPGNHDLSQRQTLNNWVTQVPLIFREVSFHIFCPLFDLIICFLGVEFEKFFIDPGCQPFICNVICKYLLPLSIVFWFCWLYPFLCKSFLSWWSSNSSFLLLFPLPVVMWLVRNCYSWGHRGFCLCSLGFWWFPVSHLGLSPILNLFLCVV